MLLALLCLFPLFIYSIPLQNSYLLQEDSSNLVKSVDTLVQVFKRQSVKEICVDAACLTSEDILKAQKSIEKFGKQRSRDKSGNAKGKDGKKEEKKKESDQTKEDAKQSDKVSTDQAKQDTKTTPAKSKQETPKERTEQTEWECFRWKKKGYTLMRLTVKGDVECISDNGDKCTWVSKESECPEIKPKITDLYPVTCGTYFEKVRGYDGYQKDGHWCALALNKLMRSA